MAIFYKWGSHYAVAIGTIGLCWSAFKLANRTFNSKSAKKAALEKINEYREKNKYHSLFSKHTLKAIKDILVEKLPDGIDGDNLLPEYVDLNIWLKDAKGDDFYYLSPGAIMRVAVLGCQIIITNYSTIKIIKLIFFKSKQFINKRWFIRITWRDFN